MQSNRGEPHKARNLARASCGAKGHAKMRLNCQQILQTSGQTNNGSPRIWRSLVPIIAHTPADERR
jgi:hypothetical protein